MSETLVAARIPLDGPIPRPPLYSLLSVATEVTDELRGGANIVPYPVAMPQANDPCNTGSGRDKDIPDPLDIPDGFPVFTAYLGEICTTRSIGNWDEWRARANIALTARTSWALERQLVNGWFADAPNLSGAALAGTDPSFPGGTSGVAALVALAWLEAAIAATGVAGVIHLPPPVASFLGNVLHDDRGTLRTASGTPVAVGSGYWFPDSDTSGDPTGGTSAAAGQSWCYATGPVLYQASGLFSNPETIAEARTDTNEVTYRAERDLWVGWDESLKAAVLADWSP